MDNFKVEPKCNVTCDNLSKVGATHMNARATLSKSRKVKENGGERLSFVQRKVILKWYRKFKNVCKVKKKPLAA
jgi:hypothetical protein